MRNRGETIEAIVLCCDAVKCTTRPDETVYPAYHPMIPHTATMHDETYILGWFGITNQSFRWCLEDMRPHYKDITVSARRAACRTSAWGLFQSIELMSALKVWYLWSEVLALFKWKKDLSLWGVTYSVAGDCIQKFSQREVQASSVLYFAISLVA